MEFNVAELIERVARNVPDREAVICGDQRATYRHFDETANQFARYLLSVGLGKGDHVGIYGYNSIEWVESMIACYKIGAIPININYRYVEEELFYIFNDANLENLPDEEPLKCPRCNLLHMITEKEKAVFAKVVGVEAIKERVKKRNEVKLQNLYKDEHARDPEIQLKVNI